MTIWYIPRKLEKIRQRGLTPEMVEAVLAAPEISAPGNAGRTKSWGLIDGRGIMVIHEPGEDGSTIVVTAYRMKRRPRT